MRIIVDNSTRCTTQIHPKIDDRHPQDQTRCVVTATTSIDQDQGHPAAVTAPVRPLTTTDTKIPAIAMDRGSTSAAGRLDETLLGRRNGVAQGAGLIPREAILGTSILEHLIRSHRAIHRIRFLWDNSPLTSALTFSSIKDRVHSCLPAMPTNHIKLATNTVISSKATSMVIRSKATDSTMGRIEVAMPEAVVTTEGTLGGEATTTVASMAALTTDEVDSLEADTN